MTDSLLFSRKRMNWGNHGSILWILLKLMKGFILMKRLWSNRPHIYCLNLRTHLCTKIMSHMVGVTRPAQRRLESNYPRLAAPPNLATRGSTFTHRCTQNSKPLSRGSLRPPESRVGPPYQLVLSKSHHQTSSRTQIKTWLEGMLSQTPGDDGEWESLPAWSSVGWDRLVTPTSRQQTGTL